MARGEQTNRSLNALVNSSRVDEIGLSKNVASSIEKSLKSKKGEVVANAKGLRETALAIAQDKVNVDGIREYVDSDGDGDFEVQVPVMVVGDKMVVASAPVDRGERDEGGNATYNLRGSYSVYSRDLRPYEQRQISNNNMGGVPKFDSNGKPV